MKKKTFIVLAIILVILNFLLLVHLYQINKSDGEKDLTNKLSQELIGNWKVKKHIATRIETRGHYFEEHYLGRSIMVDDHTVTESLRVEGWPDNLDYYVQPYTDTTLVIMTGKEYGGTHGLILDILPFDSENIQLVHFENNGLEVTDFVITKNGVYYYFFDGLYLVEPFREVKTNISPKKLLGKWTIKEFISYDDTWIGTKDQYDRNQWLSTIADRFPYKREQYGDFEISDYIGKEIEIDKQSIQSEWFTDDFSKVVVNEENTAEFEEYRQIHDKLGVTNDSIEVFYLTKDNESIENIQGDGRVIVAVSKNEIMLHLGEGWFLLEKQ